MVRETIRDICNRCQDYKGEKLGSTPNTTPNAGRIVNEQKEGSMDVNYKRKTSQDNRISAEGKLL